MYRSCPAAGKFIPVDHQHADRICDLSNSGYIFNGSISLAHFHGLQPRSLIAHLGGFAERRSLHRTCRDRIQLWERTCGQSKLPVYRESAGNVTTTMLIGQAVTQTPSIFALLVSFILMFKSYPESDTLNAAMALLSSGICTGIGGIGPGIGNGLVAESAVKWVARNLEHANDLTKVMMVGQAVSQSTAVYAMVVSLVLIFVV